MKIIKRLANFKVYSLILASLSALILAFQVDQWRWQAWALILPFQWLLTELFYCFTDGKGLSLVKSLKGLILCEVLIWLIFILAYFEFGWPVPRLLILSYILVHSSLLSHKLVKLMPHLAYVGSLIIYSYLILYTNSRLVLHQYTAFYLALFLTLAALFARSEVQGPFLQGEKSFYRLLALVSLIASLILASLLLPQGAWFVLLAYLLALVIQYDHKQALKRQLGSD
ncbi:MULTISPECIES: hypothetical protein [Aerococcus]|uniref:Uncharacterized protein n=1 Tax=Aerococcus sanguinicola TaxID=119206 RepID=A0A5N1GNY1_9LACT|nr:MULTISPECIES: hypothetical protein [Aerococcus]KAA9302114.1 hypothetical protein F6I03_02575 [Aerococcus sanguinicola]MDK6368457.1 hypothetical protein [Aerococcus sp. UMB9870]MDK6679540.1 hypothetical protein [Aerococcus sp. UMB8608]MDK6686384.1 hypothetical protein [Aerococcus sp. UMB8623]MDK6940994.1 hypothetical protein [Aerococcus sp. UMB8487]